MATDLNHLISLIKKDPEGYKEEFELQRRHYESLFQIFQLKPSQQSEEFMELLNFLSHVATCYPKDMANFPKQLISLLEQHGSILSPQVRKSMVSALILMRNRDFFPIITLMPLFFKLFRVQDKQMRSQIYGHIISDIKRVNNKTRAPAVNKPLQNLMYAMLKDDSQVAAKKCLDVLTELYKKKIWNDEKTVNVISTAVFSKHPGLVVGALNFFLGVDERDEDAGSGSEDETDAKRQMQAKELRKSLKNNASKRSRGKIEKMEKKLSSLEKRKKKDPNGTPNFSAIMLLNDPQGFADKMFGVLSHSKERFEVRLLMMNLISRLIGAHSLMCLNFYPFLQNYMEPHQKNITQILAYVIQATHDLVPPEDIEPLVRTLANHFVNDRSQPEVIAIGLNTIREICARQPNAMNSTLLQDLTQYKKYKDKGVIMAARSLLQLYRQQFPMLLSRKDRGKFTDLSATPVAYGASKAVEHIPDVELLQKYEEMKGDVEDEDDKVEKEKNLPYQLRRKQKRRGTDADDWVDVSSDEEEENPGQMEIASDSASDYDLEGFEDDLNSDDGKGEGESNKEEDGWEGWESASLDSEDMSEEESSSKSKGKKKNSSGKDKDVWVDEETGQAWEWEEMSEEEEEEKPSKGKKSTGDSSKSSKKEKEVWVDEDTGDMWELESNSSGDEGVAESESEEEVEEEKPKAKKGSSLLSSILAKRKAAKDAKTEKKAEGETEGEKASTEQKEASPETNTEAAAKPVKKGILKNAGEAGPVAETTEVPEMWLKKEGDELKSLQAPKITLDSVRILTDKDFERLDRLRVRKDVESVRGSKRSRAQSAMSSSTIFTVQSEKIDPTTLESYSKRRKTTHEERMASIVAGREDRKFRKLKEKKKGGTTNKEKLKNKPFAMSKDAWAVRSKKDMSKKAKKEKEAIAEKRSQNFSLSIRR